jgi:hypothetical protein
MSQGLHAILSRFGRGGITSRFHCVATGKPIQKRELALFCEGGRTLRPMKATLRALFVLAAATLFTGCFQMEKIISVKPDGSGTITETVSMSKATVDQMKQMFEGIAKGFGGDAKSADANPSKGFDLLDEKKLREEATKMGEGVTFVSAKKISDEKGEGYVATFAFTDINKLRIDQNPGDAMPNAGGLGGAPKADAKSEPITFQFKKGSVAQLTIKNPTPAMKPKADAKKDAADDSANAGGEEMAMAMMQQMMKDMRLVVAVEVAGKIVKTDAENVSGNRATLAEMDFNKLLANPEKFKQLSKANPQSIEEAKAIVKGIDGFKVETKPSVSIQFQ